MGTHAVATNAADRSFAGAPPRCGEKPRGRLPHCARPGWSRPWRMRVRRRWGYTAG